MILTEINGILTNGDYITFHKSIQFSVFSMLFRHPGTYEHG